MPTTVTDVVLAKSDSPPSLHTCITTCPWSLLLPTAGSLVTCTAWNVLASSLLVLLLLLFQMPDSLS